MTQKSFPLLLLVMISLFSASANAALPECVDDGQPCVIGGTPCCNEASSCSGTFPNTICQ
jgi:hypothetical protein